MGRNSPALTPQSWVQPPWPTKQCGSELHATRWTCSFRFRAGPGWGQVEEDSEPPCTGRCKLRSSRPTRRAAGTRKNWSRRRNLFGGKQFQASALCACTLLPTNLVLSVIRPGKRTGSTGQGAGLGWGAGAGSTLGSLRRWSQQGLLPASAVRWPCQTRTLASRRNEARGGSQPKLQAPTAKLSPDSDYQAVSSGKSEVTSTELDYKLEKVAHSTHCYWPFMVFQTLY